MKNASNIGIKTLYIEIFCNCSLLHILSYTFHHTICFSFMLTILRIKLAIQWHFDSATCERDFQDGLPCRPLWNMKKNHRLTLVAIQASYVLTLASALLCSLWQYLFKPCSVSKLDHLYIYLEFQ